MPCGHCCNLNNTNEENITNNFIKEERCEICDCLIKNKVKIYNEKECFVCLDAKAAVVCLPCGHFAMCVKCALIYLENNFNCPCCNEPIKSISII